MSEVIEVSYNEQVRQAIIELAASSLESEFTAIDLQHRLGWKDTSHISSALHRFGERGLIQATKKVKHPRLKGDLRAPRKCLSFVVLDPHMAIRTGRKRAPFTRSSTERAPYKQRELPFADQSITSAVADILKVGESDAVLDSIRSKIAALGDFPRIPEPISPRRNVTELALQLAIAVEE